MTFDEWWATERTNNYITQTQLARCAWDAAIASMTIPPSSQPQSQPTPEIHRPRKVTLYRWHDGVEEVNTVPPHLQKEEQT